MPSRYLDGAVLTLPCSCSEVCPIQIAGGQRKAQAHQLQNQPDYPLSAAPMIRSGSPATLRQRRWLRGRRQIPIDRIRCTAPPKPPAVSSLEACPTPGRPCHWNASSLDRCPTTLHTFGLFRLTNQAARQLPDLSPTIHVEPSGGSWQNGSNEPPGYLQPCPSCSGTMIIIETFERTAQPRAPPPRQDIGT